MPEGDAPPSAIEAAIAAGEETFNPHSRELEADVRRQMETMFRRDRLMGIVFVVAMLVVMPFVLIAVWGHAPSTGVRVVLVVSCAIVLIYNVASMLALIDNSRRDRDFIYRRDVAHLRERDALRAAKGMQ